MTSFRPVCADDVSSGVWVDSVMANGQSSGQSGSCQFTPFPGPHSFPVTSVPPAPSPHATVLMKQWRHCKLTVMDTLLWISASPEILDPKLDTHKGPYFYSTYRFKKNRTHCFPCKIRTVHPIYGKFSGSHIPSMHGMSYQFHHHILKIVEMRAV